MTTLDYPVPADDADDREFIRFARAFNAYQVFSENHEERKEIHRRVRLRWEQAGELPNDLRQLRTCLFMRARAHHHAGDGEPFKDERLVRALVDKIRAISDKTLL
ncbi:hypothetical protein ACFWU5_20415 [Nocardia sp. NPDC058640]|uniref:hypothetical protein n=1 Tax=Nocardia sp. NPDC058640 TaxID=3346571 RepID=UPI003663A189